MNQRQRTVVGVQFQPVGKVYHFDATGHEGVTEGDFVIVETIRGRQIGQVVSLRRSEEGSEEREDRLAYKPIEGRATGRDLALYQYWKHRAVEALETGREAVAEMGLPLKLVHAEYTYDGKRLMFSYVSEADVETQELRTRLNRAFRAKVELRHIGPRDEAKLLAGYGACGEERCCSRFLCEFSPISIKMAKTQGVALTPSEITGMCGRLRCCLIYEQEMYQEASEPLPRRKARVNTPYGVGKVVDLLPLKGAVVVQVEDRRIELDHEQVELVTE